MTARLAGALWLLIIACGIYAEVGVRMRLFVPGDAATTAERILAAPGLLRLGFLADTTMFLADVALAALLYVLLRPAGRALAAVAAAFRLTQAAVLALNLLHQHAAVLILDDRAISAAFAPEQLRALAHLALDVHRHGYDLALFPFGVHCLLLGAAILRSGLLPRTLGVLAIVAGVVYLAGSTVRFAAPGRVEAIQPIYLVALVAELALAVWLLVRGVRAGSPSGTTAAPMAACLLVAATCLAASAPGAEPANDPGDTDELHVEVVQSDRPCAETGRHAILEEYVPLAIAPDRSPRTALMVFLFERDGGAFAGRALDVAGLGPEADEVLTETQRFVVRGRVSGAGVGA